MLFPIAAVLFYNFPPIVHEGADFSASSPTPIIFCVLIGAIRTGVQWCLIVCICASPTISEAEHLFM